MFNLRSYLKFLSRNKLYSLVTILGFAVSLMFAFLLSVYVRQELSVDHFHANKDRIYLMVHDSQGGSPSSSFSNPVANVVMDKCPEVEAYTRIVTRSTEIEPGDREKIKAETLFADSTFFRIFSFPLTEGDASHALDVKQSAVISQSYAAKVFPNENPVGKNIRIKDVDVTINGVMKDFPLNTIFRQPDLVLNYRMIEQFWYANVLNEWGNSSFPLFLLARPGADLQAKAPLLLEDFTKDYWLFKQGFAKTVDFVKLPDVYFGGIDMAFGSTRHNDASVVSTYLGIVLLILIVAVLNYINLSVSQAMKRGRESAVKKLLGSSQSAVFMQYIYESSFMTFVSLLLGIFTAFLAEPFFNDALSTNLHLAGQFTPGFILVLAGGAVLIGAISGMFPAWVVSHFEPIEVVKGTYSYRVKAVYSKILITFQYVVAIVLLIYSVFIVRQNDYLMNFDLGFNKENLFFMQNKLDKSRMQGLRDRLTGISGVENVTIVAGNPLDGGNNNSFNYKGEPVSTQVFVVDSAFFDVFDIAIRPTGATPTGNVAHILNQKGYDILQPDEMTHEIVIEYGDGDASDRRLISGVIDNIHFRSLHEAVGPLMIELKNEYDYWAWSIVVKMTPGVDIFHTADMLKAAYADYSGETIIEARFSDEIIQGMYESDKKNMKIILAFTILTVVILMMGILSMALYYVRQREKEIAVRKVHGSTELEVLSMLNRNFIRIIAVAFVIAVPAAYWFSSQFLQGFAYKIGIDWWVFIIAGIFIVLLSMLFVSIQSWRTVTSNPVKMLKSE
jgi:putative ABC transport system permease protein